MLRNRVGYRFAVDAYDRMIENGFLTPKDRVELIRGEIVAKMVNGKKHSARVRRLTRLFSRVIGDLVMVDSQNPIVLLDREPEPDVALLKLRDNFYESRKPRPKDVLLAVEVSDSSIEDDRDVKGPLYAENGIVEYWIINLDEDCLDVYRSPRANGTYRKKQVLHRGDTVRIGALPGISFAVADLL
jgi:Uma2 family endonuclease